MKTVKLEDNKKSNVCLNFRQVSLIIILSLTSMQIFSIENSPKLDKKREPASAFEEEVLTVPLEQKVTIQSLFAEDDAGVMKGMRDSLSAWQATEDYAQKWDLHSTHLYNTPNTKQKRLYITQNLLKYADKRLAGEVRNAEEGSTLHTVGRVEKSLRPNAVVPVSRFVSIKFKASVLEGKAIMDVRNPWVECKAIVGVNGKAKILTKKDFNQLGTSTGIEYKINDSQWIAFVDQEITKNIKARLSSTTIPNTNDADKRVEMNASFPLNL